MKKKKQLIVDSVPSEPLEDLWDLVEEKTEIPVQKERNDYFNEKIPTSTVNDKSSSHQFSAKNVGKSNLKKEFLKKSVKENKKNDTMKDFSLRKAVVYSEILNRKYT